MSRTRSTHVLVAAVVLAGLAGCGGGTEQPAPTAAGSAPSATGSAAAPSGGSPSSTAPTTSAPPPPAATTPVPAPTPGDTASTVAPRPVSTRKPVKLDQPARPTDDVSVRLTRLRAVQAKAQGPGEVSGPGLEVRVQVRNGRSSALDLSAANVTLTAADDDPGQLMSGSTEPLPTSVAGGGSATGTYVFTVPKSQRDPVEIVVTSVLDGPVVAFKGRAPR